MVFIGPYISTGFDQSVMYIQPEKMIGTTTDDNASLRIVVPVGHEDLARSTKKTFDEMPTVLKAENLNLWFSSFPDPETDTISNQYGIPMSISASNDFNDGYTSIYIWGNGTEPKSFDKETFAHELAHTFDGSDYFRSNSLEYHAAIDADYAIRSQIAASSTDPRTKTFDVHYLDKYSEESAGVFKGTSRELSEDFAQSVARLVTNRPLMISSSPNRLRYLESIGVKT
jgi:hypothetical protein